MVRTQFYRNISEETGIRYSDVVKVIKAMEDEVMDIIADNDSINFSFATIGGKIKAPWRITGYYRILSKPEKRNGWSVAKSGFPYCEFTKDAKYYTPIPPEEYFAELEHRYTSKARLFRQENNLPEIPEYAGLSEEKIVELCQSQDKKKFDGASDIAIQYAKRHEKCRQKEKENREFATIQKDLQEQRDAGIPEEELIHRSYEEIIKNKEQSWKQYRENYKKAKELAKEGKLDKEDLLNINPL